MNAKTKQKYTELRLAVELGAPDETKQTRSLQNRREDRPQVSVACRGLCFSLPNSANELQTDNRILEDIDFDASPGRMVAILGSSGSGKTTLLECLIGRPPTSGEVFWFTNDDHGGKTPHVAYVQQTCRFMPSQTVRETLQTAADLQLPDDQWTAEQRQEWVDTTLRELNLGLCGDNRVGSDTADMRSAKRKGISGGERRRLAIGLELLASPSVLVLDEPTSGLDSHGAMDVINVLKDVAKKGCTVILTIHQPSGGILQCMDDIVILSKGQVFFAGQQNEVEAHLQSIGEPSVVSGNRISPIDRLVELAASDESEKYMERFRQSKAEGTKKTIHKAAEHKIDCVPKPKTTMWRQFKTLCKRNFRNQYRDHAVFFNRLIMYAALCCFVGTLFGEIKPTNMDDRLRVQYFISSSLISLTVACIPSLIEEKAVYVQETGNGHYGPIPYAMMHCVTCIPYLLLISCVCTGILQLLMGLFESMERVLIYAVAMFLTLYCAESLMAAIAIGVQGSMFSALIWAGGFMAVGVLLCGFFKPPSRLPIVWYWIHQGTFQAYHFAIILHNDLTGLSSLSSTASSNATSNIAMASKVMTQTFELDAKPILVCFVVILGITLLWRIVFGFGLWARKRRSPFA